MVIERMETESLLDVLFSSRVRARVLAILLMNPGTRWHARALARAVGAQYSGVWKELAHLERAGVLESENAGPVKYYRVNPQLPILSELRGMVLKTVGLGDAIRKTLEGQRKIDAAFLYGSFASGEMDASSDVDLMIIGEAELKRLAPVITRLERELGRAVNYVVFTREEWAERLERGDPFVRNVLAEPKVMLVGDEDGLQRVSAARADQALRGSSNGNQKAAPGRRPRSGRGRAKSGG